MPNHISFILELEQDETGAGEGTCPYMGTPKNTDMIY